MLRRFRESFLHDYVTPGHPISYSGIDKIFEYYNRQVPKKTIETYLTFVNHYPKHKETHKRYTNPYYVYKKRHQVQADLFEIRNLSRQNSGFNYVLTVIDVFTRKAWVRPSKTKISASIAKLFDEILTEMVEVPKQFLSDRGSEFVGQPFRDLLSRKGIKQIFGGNTIHAPYAERFNRTLQNIIYKHLTENKTKKFVNFLPQFVHTYNSRIHRMIGMSPNEAELPRSQNILYLRASKRHAKFERKHQFRKPKYKIGDLVRKKNLKNRMSRGYKQGWSENIYKIVDINRKMPVPVYKLQDKNGVPQRGTYYEYEISNTNVYNDRF